MWEKSKAYELQLSSCQVTNQLNLDQIWLLLKGYAVRWENQRLLLGEKPTLI